MEKENKLGTMPISKLIINMSLPIIASMLVQALYNIVDSVFVSRVCEQALTAVSLAFPAQNLMIGLATGTAVGVNALMGRALGAKDQQRANAVAINGVFLAVVGFVSSAVLALLFAGPFFRSQTQIDYIIDNGIDYLLICCCGSLGLFGEIMFERLLQGTGRVHPVHVYPGTGRYREYCAGPHLHLCVRHGRYRARRWPRSSDSSAAVFWH